MNVLFIYSLQYYRLKEKQVVADSIQLGISYISAFLKKHGHKTDLLVLSRFFNKKNQGLIDAYIRNFAPKLICFTAVASEYAFIAGVAKYIKSRYPGIYLLIGGPHVSLNPENILADDFDALCVGEGEYPALELISQLEKGVFPSGILNLWIKDSKGVEKNLTRPFLNDLDCLPFPDRQMWQKWVEPKDARYSILLGRGCPFQCSYCSNHALRKVAPGNYVRFRSPDNIIAEIKDMIANSLAGNEIYLEVETIAVNKEWALELCSKLESFNRTQSLPLSFGANIRVVPGADFDSLFAAMKKCNVKFVNMGLESGSERVRKEVLNRNYSNNDIINAVKSARKHGLKICLFNIIGVPGETTADFKETVRVNRLCLPDWNFTSIFSPYPGTDLYRLCVQKGLIDGPLASDLERQQAVLDLPGFSKRQINKSYIWFDYYVYKGHRPLLKILKNILVLKLKIFLGSLLLLNKKYSLKIKQGKIKVALVCTTLNQLGGPNRHFEKLYKGLDKDKFEVMLFICSKSEKEVKDFMLKEGIPEEDLILLSRIKKWFLIPFILDLRKVFLNKRIDIVHTFHAQTDILAGIAGRLAGVRGLVSQFESKVIEENIPATKRFFYKFGNKLVKKHFKKTIAVSHGLKRELVLNNFRAAENIEVIHLGVDLSLNYREQVLSFDGLLNKKPVIGTIARFDKEKGLERFIKTMPLILKAVPQARFVLFGKGPEAEQLKALVTRLRLTDFVDFRGWAEDVNLALEKMDIFVMSSLREGCPNILLEALALSRPVVASDIEGIEDIIENSKDGLLVDTADTNAFAQAVISLCVNPVKAIEMGKNGKEKARTQFSMQRELSQIEKVYLDVL